MPDLQPIPIKPLEDAEKLAEAGRAMQATTTITPPEKEDTMAIAKQRLEAKLAMEGDERRRVREEEARRRQEAEKERMAEEERKKMTEAQRAKQLEEERLETEKEKAERLKRSLEITEKVEEIKSGTGVIPRPIRTLRADMENLIKTNNISLISIAIKEEEKRKRELDSRNVSSKTNLTLIIVSTLLILGTLLMGVYVYMSKNGMMPTIPNIISPGRNQPKPIIPTEKTNEIDITGKTSEEIISRTIRDEIRNPSDLLIGNTENILLTTRANNETHYLTLPEFFTIIKASPPDQLLRSLSINFMFGVLSSIQNSGFLIMTTDSYNTAFAGLLAWEQKGMTNDLYQVLTTIKPEAELLSKRYEDLTIKNIGTRVLTDKAGAIRLVYAFLDSTKTIIIAGSKEAFLDALASFQTPKPVTQ